MRLTITGGALWYESDACYAGTTEYVLYSSYDQQFGTSSAPSLCVDSTNTGLEFFKKHICPHLDPQILQSLGDNDRWWLSALNHSNSNFGKVLNACYSSFRQQPDAVDSYLGATLGYSEVVRQVTEASLLSRHKFFIWICVMGNESTIKPFLDAGFDFNAIAPGLSHSFLCLAAAFQNVEVFHTLTTHGLRLKRDQLQYCLKAPKTMEDLKFQLNILQNISPGPELCDELRPFSVVGMVISKCVNLKIDPQRQFIQRLLELGLGCYTHPPFRRGLFLGPEVLLNLLLLTPFHERCQKHLEILITIGASLDFVGPFHSNGPSTALEWAIAMGYVEHIPLLLEHANCYSDFNASLHSACKIAKGFLEEEHPRCCPIKTEDQLREWPIQAISHVFQYRHKATCGVTWDLDHRSYELIQGALAQLTGSPAESGVPIRMQRSRLELCMQLCRHIQGNAILMRLLLDDFIDSYIESISNICSSVPSTFTVVQSSRTVNWNKQRADHSNGLVFYLFLVGFCLVDVLISLFLVIILRFLFLMLIVTSTLFSGEGKCTLW